MAFGKGDNPSAEHLVDLLRRVASAALIADRPIYGALLRWISDALSGTHSLKLLDWHRCPNRAMNGIDWCLAHLSIKVDMPTLSRKLSIMVNEAHFVVGFRDSA